MNKKILKFIKNNKNELDAFFGTKLNVPNIELVANRKAFNDYWNRKTEDWEVGWAKGDDIFILDPKIYTKESSHKDIKHFWDVLKHEHVHYYFRKTTKINYPKWLNEGLANYLAKQTKKQPDIKEVLDVTKYFRESDFKIYSTGYFWVSHLIKKFGKTKLKKLLKTLKPNLTKLQFSQNFEKIYGVKFTKKELKKLL